MKIACIADCHLNKTSYKNDNLYTFTTNSFRSQDFMNSLEFIINDIVENVSPNLVLFLGDIYETFDPPNNVTGFFSKQLRRLSDAKIPVIILVGNHDICCKNHALQSLLELNLKNIKVIDKPTILKFDSKLLMLFPYSLDVEKKLISIKDQFVNFIKETKTKIENNLELQKCDIIFTGHFSVNGAYLSKYELEDGTEKKYLNSHLKDISVSDLDTIGASYVFLGDFHKHQVLPTKKCKAMYIGSIERTDMSEANDEKGYIVYDSEAVDNDVYGKCKFIKNPNLRPILKLDGNISEINTQINNLDEKSKGAIVQINFESSSSEMSEFDNAQNDIINRLKSVIDPICIRKENIIVNPEIKMKVQKLEKDLQCAPIGVHSIMNIIKEMIDDREQDENVRAALYSEAESIENSIKTKKQG